MSIKVAINGYGRIGRNILRAHYEGAGTAKHRHDLAIEEAVVLGCDGALLAAKREPIHLLAADLLAGGDVLSGLSHRQVQVREFAA